MIEQEMTNVINAVIARAEVLAQSPFGKYDMLDIVSLTTEAVYRLGVKMIAAIIGALERRYNEQRNKSKIKIKERHKKRSLLTSMGELRFERAIYYDVDRKKYFYALDDMLKIEKYSRVDPALEAQIVKDATITSYGKASQRSGVVSRQTVYNKVRRLKNIDSVKTNCKDNSSLQSVKTQDKNKTIYIEADEDHIHLNNGDGAEVKLAYVHEGVRTVCKGRTELVNPHYFVALTDDADTFWNDVSDYVRTTYHVRNQNIVISGDGASWIRIAERVIPGATYHIDKFHVQKAATRLAKGDMRIRAEILKAVNFSEKEKLANICRKQLARCVVDIESERRAVGQSYLYLRDNLTYYASSNRCSAEGHVSHVLSERMSSRPMGWSIAGAERIAKLRAFLFNGGDFNDLVRNGKYVPTPQLDDKKIDNRRFWRDDGRNGVINPSRIPGSEVVGGKYSHALKGCVRVKRLEEI